MIKPTLRVLRASRKMSMKQAAEAIGVSLNQWENWELGRSKPKVEHALKVAKYFGFTVEEIFLD